MLKIVYFMLSVMLVFSADAFARAGSSFSSSRSSSFSSSRSSSSYSAPSRSYSTSSYSSGYSSYSKPTSYQAVSRPSSYATPAATSTTYRSTSYSTPVTRTTVVNNYGGGYSSGSDHFMSSMAGSFVGSSIANHMFGTHYGYAQPVAVVNSGGGYVAGGAPMAVAAQPVVVQPNPFAVFLGYLFSFILIVFILWILYIIFKAIFGNRNDGPHSRYS